MSFRVGTNLSFDLQNEVTLETNRLLSGDLELLFSARVDVNDNRDNADQRTPSVVTWPAVSDVLIGNRLLARATPGEPSTVHINRRGGKGIYTWTLVLHPDALNSLEALRAGRAIELVIQCRIVVQHDGVESFTERRTVRIAASDWTERLSEHGFNQVLHFELPLGVDTDFTTNQHLLTQVRNANRKFEVGDYSGCVAIVRDLWDAVLKEFDPSGRWDAILTRGLTPAMATEVSEYAKKLRNLVNKGHHRSEVSTDGTKLYDFTRSDAEFILHSAFAFLRYLGQLSRSG